MSGKGEVVDGFGGLFGGGFREKGVAVDRNR